MSKKAKKALNVATFGLSGAAEKLTLDPIKAAASASANALGISQAPIPDQSAAQAGSVTAPEPTPTSVSPDTLAAREAQRKRQAAYAGLSANILTGAAGLAGTAANTQLKSLLGS